MALFQAYVTKWQTDSWKRVYDTVNGTLYVLNTIRMDSIRVLTGTAASGTSSLYYFDNPFDHKDSGKFMEVCMCVDDLIHYINTAVTHGSITLNMYIDNDPTLATEEVEIPTGSLAFAVADRNVATRSWVLYSLSGWDVKKVLVNDTLAAIEAAAMS